MNSVVQIELTLEVVLPAFPPDQIRVRAYELYEAPGREDGHEPEDWLHAEEGMASKKVRTAAA